MRDFLYFFCGQSDQKSDVIRLYFCFMCRAVAPDLSAFFAAVYNHISFFDIRFCFDSGTIFLYLCRHKTPVSAQDGPGFRNPVRASGGNP